MKVILVDDEQLAVDYLARMLKKHNQIEIIGTYLDPIEARRDILVKEVDLIFLDISLPEINGIQLAEQILEKKPDINIVFVTAYNEYAVKAFELNAMDYLVKPVRSDRLARTIARIKDEAASKQEEKTEHISPIMRLNRFKQVSVEISNTPISVIHWRTTKAQELFLYLLQHRGQLVRKSVLIDTLWPEYESDKVYSQLYTAIYHVRKTLAQFAEHFQIMNAMEGYILSINQVLLDVEEWENRLAAEEPLSFATIDHYIETMKLYTGDYLLEYDYWWAESERERLKKLWLSMAYEIANWYEKQGQLDKSIIWYDEICLNHVQEEQAHFSLMKIYEAMDHHLLVNRQYSILTTALLTEFNEQPSDYIIEWFKQREA